MEDKCLSCGSVFSMILFMALIGTAYAQAPVVKPERDLKIFEAAVSLTNTLTSWALVMIGGSILAILSTSYYRPRSLWFRSTYLVFIPAWVLLSLSIYSGTRVQSVYLAALYSRTTNLDNLQAALNSDASAQILRMETGLCCFGLWIFAYLMWWIFNKE